MKLTKVFIAKKSSFCKLVTSCIGIILIHLTIYDHDIMFAVNLLTRGA